VQQIKQTEINLKNTYQNIHRHSVTHKNNHFKNIVNLTKNVNYEYTENDFEFQYAVLKTIKNSNQYVENKITKIIVAQSWIPIILGCNTVSIISLQKY
jgi:hypothetical protein